jgi:hypothetical protein
VGSRPRHPRKELEALLKEAESNGWRVTKGRRYYTIWCPCPGRHRETVHLTPSGSNYERNLRAHLRNLRAHLRLTTCWEASR